MDRYIKYYTIAADPNVIYASLGQYLQSEGYEYINYHDENVFQKGKGLVAAPSFFKFLFSGNTMKLEAWIKYAIFPGVYVSEIGDLDGFAGSVIKKQVKKRIEAIDQIMMGFAPQPQYAPMPQPANQFNSYSANPQPVNPNHSPEYPPHSDVPRRVFCISCGTEQPEGVDICISCGAPIAQTQTQVPPAQFGNPNEPYVYNPESPFNPDGTPVPIPGQPVSRAEFINTYAPKSIKKDIVNIAVVCYVCAGATFLLSLFTNPWGIIDALVLLAPAIGMHIKKSRACAIAIFVISIIECIIGLLAGSVPYLWLIAGIFAFITFNKIEKKYKQFLESFNLQ